MADLYLNKTVLGYFYNRIKTIFAKQTDLTTLSGRVDTLVSEGGEPNVIEGIKVNDAALTPVEKVVNISVPTKVSDLTNDGDGTAGSAFATQEYVTSNGGKIDKIKVNNAEQTITNKEVNITVPLATSDLTNDSNFVSDSTYVHTDNNYTTADKNKLDGISSGAEANVQADWGETDTSSDAYIANKPVIPTAVSDLTNDSNFVSDASYVHTDNNYTTAYKEKLEGIATGAEVNVQSDWDEDDTTSDAYIANKPSIPTAVSDLTNDSGFQTADDVAAAIGSAVASAYVYKGSVATVDTLPASGNAAGDVYDVQATGMNYAWNGTAWDALGQYVDTSAYWAVADLTAITTAEIDQIISEE